MIYVNVGTPPVNEHNLSFVKTSERGTEPTRELPAIECDTITLRGLDA
jgi:hypothetical protein